MVSGCDECISFDYRFPDQYDAVYCFVPERDKAWVKDTTICFSKEDLVLLSLDSWGDGRKGGQVNLGLGTMDDLFYHWQCDTVSFFIFDKEIVENQSWDYIVQNYCVLQRYDFSKEDLERINCQISYPPTADMANIHMYPPYED